MAKNLKLTILISIVFQVNAAFAQKINVGPYIQRPNEKSHVIKWYTEEACPTILEYTSDNKNFYTYEINGLSLEHEIALYNLEPNTKYTYSIFTKKNNEYHVLENKAELDEFSFKYNDNDKLKVWVLGDPGVRGDPEMAGRIHRTQLKVKKEFFKYLEDNEIEKDLDFIIALGDNAYPRGTFTQYKEGFFDPYSEHLGSYTVFSAFGNHDGGIDKRGLGIKASARSYPEPHGVYYDIFSLPGNEAYYSFDRNNTHFIFLDSFDSLWEDFDGNNYEKVWTEKSSHENKMLKWLEADLKSNTQQWTVVSFHHPPFGQSEHPEEKKQDIWKAWTNAYITPLLHKYKVDIILMGHIHNYQRSYPISLKRNDIDRSRLKPQKHLKEEKKAFREKYIGILDDLDLPHYSAIPSSLKKDTYIKNNDPIYVIMGSSGAAFKELPDKKNRIFFMNKQKAGSAFLEITGSSLNFKFIGSDGDLIDKFTIED
jgi:acid phosphatase type 7